MFVGRKTELAFLQDKYDEKRGQLVVLYGRRRVGKTETLREFCKGKPHIFYSCTQSTDKVQLAKFSQQIFKEYTCQTVHFSVSRLGECLSLCARASLW